MTIEMQSLMAYILVFCRMGGMIFFNPLLLRREVPARIRVALALALTILVAPTVSTGAPTEFDNLALVFAITKELFVGILCGFIFQIYYYLLFFIGDIMDIEFGLSMAKIFDPATNIQMSISGSLLQILFSLYLFVTDSHLLMIRIFTSSYDILPLGGLIEWSAAPGFVIDQFISVFSLVIRLGLPFIAAGFAVQIAMGILMKLIPQINVFVINIQIKILLGLALMFLFAGPIGTFTDNYMNMMFEYMQKALFALQPTG